MKAMKNRNASGISRAQQGLEHCSSPAPQGGAKAANPEANKPESQKG